MKKTIVILALALAFVCLSSCGIATTALNEGEQAKPVKYNQPTRYNHNMSTNMPYRYNPTFSNQGFSDPNRGSNGPEKSGK